MLGRKRRFFLLQLGYCPQCSAWLFPWQVQHSQSNHIDRYLVCGERYQALRDAVGRAMMEGTAQGLLEAEKVQPSPPSRPLLGPVLTRPLLGFGWLQLGVPVGSVCSHGGTWGLLLGGHCGLCSSTRFLYFPTCLPHHCSWDSSGLFPATSLVLFQASSGSPALESAHLLLAIFREVTALYGARDPSLHPKQQVGCSPLEACDKPASWMRMKGI